MPTWEGIKSAPHWWWSPCPLSVVLLDLTFQFTGGFSMEKYLEQKTCADFIVGNTDYFRFQAKWAESGLAGETVEQIRENTEETDAGSGLGGA